MPEGRQQRYDDFIRIFPEGRKISDALQSDQNRTPFFFFHESGDPDLKGCVLVIGRLGTGIESKYGLHSEVVFLFTPYRDLQRRSFNALTSRARAELRRRLEQGNEIARFTPDRELAFIVTPDERAHEKVHEWNATSASSFAVPIITAGRSAEELLNDIVRGLAVVREERDLYGGRNPVIGNAFFGRNDLLRRITSSVREGQSLGFFGLRRSGKTSVIREFQRRTANSRETIAIVDLESLDKLEDLPSQISEELDEEIRRKNGLGGGHFLGSQEDQRVESIAQLSARLKRLAKRNSDLRFVLAIDEIESLTRFARNDPEQTRSILGALRAVAQGTENTTLIVTGVTMAFFEESTLAPGVDNPLFGFVTPVFLKPFALEESRNLVKSLGSKMLLSWDDDAADLVHQAAGGFPFLVRDLASAVRQRVVMRRSDPLEQIPVTVADVDAIRGRWAEQSAPLWEQIVHALDEHHPIMAALLISSGADVDQWLEAGAEADSAARALEELGLFMRDNGSYTPTPALEALKSLGRIEKRSVDEIERRVAADRDLRKLIQDGEDAHLEFKSTARWNLQSRAKDPAIEESALKTIVGFANADGGTLLIGVTDEGEAIGLAEDLKLCKHSEDRFQNWLLNDLLGTQCGDDIVAELVNVGFPQLGGKTICRVDVRPSNRAVWVDRPNRGSFFVRRGNSTAQLTGAEEHAYISSHWA